MSESRRVDDWSPAHQPYAIAVRIRDGEGPQQQINARTNVSDKSTVAREFWSFGYDPNAGKILIGSREIDIDAACDDANLSKRVIYAAAREMDWLMA